MRPWPPCSCSTIRRPTSQYATVMTVFTLRLTAVGGPPAPEWHSAFLKGHHHARTLAARLGYTNKFDTSQLNCLYSPALRASSTGCNRLGYTNKFDTSQLNCLCPHGVSNPGPTD